MKKILLAGLILLAISGCSAVQPSNEASKESEPAKTSTSSSVKTSVSAEVSLPLSLSVAIKGFAFSPASVKIKKGGKVTWTNSDTVAHSIVGNDGSFGSTLLSKGQSYSFTFNSAGTFSYFCGPHPNMKGTVVVE